jgi:transglutaminase-like putative cysteine protease
MSQRGALETLLLTVALLAIATYAVADANATLALLALPGAAAAWWLTRTSASRVVPRPLINALLVGAVGYAVLRAVRVGFEVEGFSEFVSLLIVIKLLDRRMPRDDAQVLSLSTFLVVGALLTSNTLAVGAMLFGFVPILIFAVVLHQLDIVARRTSPAAMPDRTNGRRSIRRDIRRLVGVSWVVGTALAAVAFILMPRGVGTSAFGQWGNASVGSVVGFNDEITLGTGGLISQSPEPVMDVRILDRESRNIGAPLRTFYLRGAVLDAYRNGRWVRDSPLRRSGNERGPVTFGAASPILLGGTPSDWDYEIRFTLRQASARGSHLFSVWQPERLLMYTPVSSVFHDMQDGTMLVTGQSGKVEYTVWSDQNLERPFPAFDGAAHGDLADRSSSSDAIRQLASSILTDAGIPADPAQRDGEANIEAARLLASYFTRERFEYDLDEPVSPRDRDPTEWFLFETRRGHCEYYASAMASMARSIGLPARVVTGYVASEFNETTGHYLVRASNAHAWVEVEPAPQVWRPFDPTPREDFGRLHEQRDEGPLAVARRLLETVEFAWIRAVVGFDDTSRARLLGDQVPTGRDVLRALTGVLDRAQAGGADLIAESLANAAIAFAAVFVLGTFVQVAWVAAPTLLPRLMSLIAGLRSRGAGTATAADRSLDAALARSARVELDRAFRRLGAPRPAWRPVRRHSAGVALSADRVPSPIDRVAQAVYRVRFGGKPLSPDERTALQKDVRDLRRVGRSR